MVQETVGASQLMARTSGLITSKITKITSNVPTSVYACYILWAASDCTNFYPISTWGSKYRYLYAKSQFGSTYPEQLTVITGTETATLTIRPKTTIVTATGTYTADTNYSVTVPPNTIWQTNNQNAGEDFSGMLVSSSSQISLLAGAECENFGTTFTGIGGACDASIQAVPPISSWGSKFYSANYRNSGSTGSGYRVT
ncbi:MAG: IgGFc-binding protein, partial [Burkholderiaceae bacterium]|nr:IgGFc-binding protein [Burkholderiaceae bacterium]